MPRNIPDAVLALMALPEVSPVELFEIYIEPTGGSYASPSHYFARAETTITFGGQDYDPFPIKRGDMKISADIQIDHLTIGLDGIDKRVASSNDFARLVAKDAHLLTGKRMVCKRVFRSDLSDSSYYILVFDGDIDDPSFDDMVLSAKVISWFNSSFMVPKRIFGPACGYIFGSKWCTLDAEHTDNKKTGAADAGTTATVILDTSLFVQGDDYWKYGFIEFTSGDNAGIGRQITTSSSGSHTVTAEFAFPYTPAAGDTFIVRRRCNKSRSICNSAYSNQANIGAFWTIPKDPRLKTS